jgi:putative peptidoglycan lipid II flippase
MRGDSQPKQKSSSKNAFLVGLGIALSRVMGMVREWFFARYFGLSSEADAFKAALKITHFVQNLFGEGALSASFIPVYSRLLASKDKEQANRVAKAVGSILALTISIFVLAGVLITPYIIDIIQPGFKGAKRELTIVLVRILFPGVGILVLSAWCLGILNSHRRFFLPYAAPVLWNLPMIVALIFLGGKTDLTPLARYLSWAAVVGSAFQFLVQLPAVIQLVGRLRFHLDIVTIHIRTIIRNFIPSLGSRGVNQISSFVDQLLAGLVADGAVAALMAAQNLYLLPISLFGMSISSAELPEMSSHLEIGEDLRKALRNRLNDALQRVAFFVVPTVAAFLLLGDSILGLLYQGGRFTHKDVNLVWLVLAGSTVGLLAQTLGRIYASTFWALRDTRTPLKFAVGRVILTTGLGWLLAFPVPRWMGLQPLVGVAGLTVAAGLAAWVEFMLLRSSLNKEIGRTGLPVSFMTRLWGMAVPACGVAFLLKIWTAGLPRIPAGIIVMSVYGALYLGFTAAIGVPHAKRILEIGLNRIRQL